MSLDPNTNNEDNNKILFILATITVILYFIFVGYLYYLVTNPQLLGE